MTVDDQYIYLGIVVPEPYYKYRGSTAGSHIAFSLGFNRGETFYQSMDRQTFVFQIYEDKTPFYANTILIYNSTGTYTTSYNAVVFEAVAFLRDDTKGVTVYEAKVKKSEVAAIAGVDKLPKTCYIHFLNKSYDAAGNSAEFRYRCVLDDMARSIITAYDGWCATFAPHLLTFLEPGELPETVETTTPAETTTRRPKRLPQRPKPLPQRLRPQPLPQRQPPRRPRPPPLHPGQLPPQIPRLPANPQAANLPRHLRRCRLCWRFR